MSGTTLGKAYVQIVPSAQGISGSISSVLNKESSSAGTSAGNLIGTNLVGKIKTIVAAAGIGKAFAASITEGAAMEQSIGGVETLFKESADSVLKNAQNAFKTAGLSANQYMETVTSFSASLLQSLGGDTAKASAAADLAITDMSDNANKMGTSMELIQNAYQGFAKQNYTMLDNLKLGYGGTKSEMERLIADANRVKVANGEMGDLSIESFADVTEAIHIVQTEMGITGTTAAEAASTFSGSFAAMKGALQTFLGNLALGENVKPSLANLGDTIYTFLVNNAAPMVLNVITSLTHAIATTDWVGVVENTITRLRTDIETAARKILQTDGSIVDAAVKAINANLPKLLERGAGMISKIINGITKALPNVVNAGATVVSKLLGIIIKNLPQILSTGLKIVANLVAGIIKNMPTIATAGLRIAGKVLEVIKETDWLQLGKNIISGIAKGITGGVSVIVDAAKEAAKGALDAAKDFLGIHSPSTVFADQVGKMIDMGMAEGIGANVKAVTGSIDELNKAALATDMTVFSNNYNPSGATDLEKLGAYIVSAFEEIGTRQANAMERGLSNVRLVSNGREVARMMSDLGFSRG